MWVGADTRERSVKQVRDEAVSLRIGKQTREADEKSQKNEESSEA